MKYFSLFSLFWKHMCVGVGGMVSRLLTYDNGSFEGDVAALYPAVRADSLEMVMELHDIMQMELSSSDDATFNGSCWLELRRRYGRIMWFGGFGLSWVFWYRNGHFGGGQFQ